jgi:hypothetical protein
MNTCKRCLITSDDDPDFDLATKLQQLFPYPRRGRRGRNATVERIGTHGYRQVAAVR